jgi:hypothetical protein
MNMEIKVDKISDRTCRIEVTRIETTTASLEELYDRKALLEAQLVELAEIIRQAEDLRTARGH